MHMEKKNSRLLSPFQRKHFVYDWEQCHFYQIQFVDLISYDVKDWLYVRTLHDSLFLIQRWLPRKQFSNLIITTVSWKQLIVTAFLLASTCTHSDHPMAQVKVTITPYGNTRDFMHRSHKIENTFGTSFPKRHFFLWSTVHFQST